MTIGRLVAFVLSPLVLLGLVAVGAYWYFSKRKPASGKSGVSDAQAKAAAAKAQADAAAAHAAKETAAAQQAAASHKETASIISSVTSFGTALISLFSSSDAGDADVADVSASDA